MNDDLKFRIAKLELGPKDVLVVKVDQYITSETRDRVEKFVRASFGDGVKVMVIDPKIELAVLTRAEIESRAEGTAA